MIESNYFENLNLLRSKMLEFLKTEENKPLKSKLIEIVAILMTDFVSGKLLYKIKVVILFRI